MTRIRTITVAADQYDDTVRNWAQAGLYITAQGDNWVTLQRPPASKPNRSAGRAILLTVLTVGVYPFLVVTWWMLFAWWVRPWQASRRTDRITITVT